jgi:hypothetical protein
VIEIKAEAFIHRGLGGMIRLHLGENLTFNLTPQEARTLARALAAVRTGKSKVEDVYMSPIASDGDFFAKVTEDGLVLEATPKIDPLGWEEVGKIQQLLTELAPEPSDA